MTRRPVAEIEAAVEAAWTGNRVHDLAGFALGEEFEIADHHWHTLASCRYELAERRRRLLGPT